jgi:hypothetical protein
MDLSKLLTNRLQAARQSIEDIEILIKEYPFRNIDQRLRLRELQILYRTVAKSLEGGLEMFE